jgi:hypothetical protein
MTAVAKPRCAMCGGTPFSISMDPNAPLFCSLECEGNWRRQQREGSYLAALNLTPKATYEAWGDLDRGAPEEAWACAVDRFREEARINSQCAEQQRKLAEDAAEQAERHARRAEDFAKLADAIERAPITFAASADTHPKGGDVQQAPLVSGAVPNEDSGDAR